MNAHAAQTLPPTALPMWPEVAPPQLEPEDFETEPMESEHHLIALTLLYELVVGLTADCPDVFVGADLAVHFSPEYIKNRDLRAPDLFVVRGAERRERRGWVSWEEGGRLPELVVELVSPTSVERDLRTKRRLYDERWHVREYYAFELETGTLHAFGPRAGGLVERQPDPSGRFYSEVLGAWFCVAPAADTRLPERPMLRLSDASGALIPTATERARERLLLAQAAWAEAAAAEQRASEEVQRATAARAEAEAESQRAEAESQRAEAESQRAAAAERRASEEARRADALEQELRALRSQLAAGETVT